MITIIIITIIIFIVVIIIFIIIIITVIIISIIIIVTVKKWQDETQSFARRHAYVFTIMGRWRRLQDAKLSGGAAGHALRAAINTPIQGKGIGLLVGIDS